MARKILLPLLFLATCGGLLPAGRKIADPMTHRRLDQHANAAFSIVIMTDDTARLERVQNGRIPPLPPGSSYLIPRAYGRAVEAQLGPPWEVNVAELGPGRQHIEVVWVDDGYSGAGYEATASSITPRYLKITGPAFGCIFGGVALLLNVTLWLAASAAIRRWRRRGPRSRRSAPAAAAPPPTHPPAGR